MSTFIEKYLDEVKSIEDLYNLLNSIYPGFGQDFIYAEFPKELDIESEEDCAIFVEDFKKRLRAIGEKKEEEHFSINEVNKIIKGMGYENYVKFLDTARKFRGIKNKVAERIYEEQTSSDIFYINLEVREELNNLWRPKDIEKDLKIVPIDLIKAGTIPLPDIEIVTKDEEGRGIKGRVHILEKGIAADDEVEQIGYVYLEKGVGKVIYQGIFTEELKDFIDSTHRSYGFIGFNEDEKMEILRNGEGIEREFGELLEVWYGLELGLLHPAYKHTLEKRVGKEKRVKKAGVIGQKSSRREVVYIKRIRPTEEEFHLIKEKEKRVYKCLSWYVIGHYRKGAGGKVFVHGYWKGPLRESRRNYDKGRKRDLEVKTDDL